MCNHLHDKPCMKGKWSKKQETALTYLNLKSKVPCADELPVQVELVRYSYLFPNPGNLQERNSTWPQMNKD